MKKLILSAIILLFSFNTLAEEKPYTLGTVWDVSYIRVNDGKLDDYLKNLNAGYYPINEEFKKKGWVVSYKAISFTRNNPEDWNLMLLTEFPNWATFDRKEAEWDAVVDKVFKSKKNQKKSTKDRENIRTTWGSRVGRELIPNR